MVGGRTHSLGGEGGGWSIFWKTPDTALYSSYVSTLWYSLSLQKRRKTKKTKRDLALIVVLADTGWGIKPVTTTTKKLGLLFLFHAGAYIIPYGTSLSSRKM